MQGAGSFRVLDVHQAPDGGLILRLRLDSGETPSIRSIRGSELVAEGPDGDQCRLTVKGFAMFGGKASDARLSRTGRVDVHAHKADASDPDPGLRWTVRLS